MSNQQLEEAIRETLEVCDAQLAVIDEQIGILAAHCDKPDLPAHLRDQYDRTIKAFLATRESLIETRNEAVEGLNGINGADRQLETKAKLQ